MNTSFGRCGVLLVRNVWSHPANETTLVDAIRLDILCHLIHRHQFQIQDATRIHQINRKKVTKVEGRGGQTVKHSSFQSPSSSLSSSSQQQSRMATTAMMAGMNTEEADCVTWMGIIINL
jgi:hypothetical protein